MHEDGVMRKRGPKTEIAGWWR